MLPKLILILLASGAVFYLLTRGWPKIKSKAGGLARRIAPILLMPMLWQILRRVFWILLRVFLFRR